MIRDVPFNRINKDRAKDFYITAEIKYNQGQWGNCRQALTECLRYDPTHREAIELAACLFLKLKQTLSARKVLDDYKKIMAAPTKEYFLLRAKMELQSGDLLACREALDQCFAIKRDFDQALFVLADFNLRSNRTSDAIAIYERLHEKDKSNKDILYSLASAYFQQRELDGAIIYCSKLIEGGVDHPEVNGIYRRSLEEKKKRLRKDKRRTFFQNLFAFLYDPETEKQLRIHSEQEWELKRANQKGYLDEKTGILNFQALKDYFPALAGSSDEPVFVGFLDINFFKFFNDFYGSHAVGDVVLKALAKIGSDLFPGWFFRRSGDEFIFVIKGDEPSVLGTAELLRKTAEDQAVSMANEMIATSDSPLVDPSTNKPYHLDRRITVSIGIAHFKGDLKDLIPVLEEAEKNFKITHDTRKNAVVYQARIVSQGPIPEKPLLGVR
jgi:diguanylate cyclase (GGDEF)-like protein